MGIFVQPFRADEKAIRLELGRHHPVLERRDESTGTSTVTCSCGEAFGPLPDGRAVLEFWIDHFLISLRCP